MELRQYLAVVRRHWPLVAAIVALSALLSLGLVFLQRPTYTAVTRLALRQQDVPSQPPTGGGPGFYTYDNYYNWYSSEYLADDYTLIVPSQAFARQVAAQLKQNYKRDLSAGDVLPALAADRRHRELIVSTTAADPALATDIANAAADVLTAISTPAATTPNFNGVAIHDNVLFAVIDRADGAGSNRSRQLINAAVAGIVGLVLALALAFLLEYLDNSLRDGPDAERLLNLPVLGAIPGHR